VGHALRCPASKFITHTLSHACFLILLAAATFRLESKTHTISNGTSTRDFLEPVCGGGEGINGGKWIVGVRVASPEEDQCREALEILLKDSFRPANTLITNVQICLMFWILGNSRVVVYNYAPMFMLVECMYLYV